MSSFLSILPLLHDIDDQDMQKHAVILAQYYPHFPHAPFFVETVILQLIGMLLDAEAGWHAKIQVLTIIQVLYYLNLPLMSVSMELKVMDCLSELLNDSQVEVRDSAAVTLSGLIRCSQRKSINSILEKLRNSLAELPSVKRKPRSNTSEMDTAPLDTALIKKHSIILGLSSIVLAFPVSLLCNVLV